MPRPASATCCCRSGSWKPLQDEGQTIVDYLIATVLKDTPEDWRRYVIAGVSDVDDARSIDLLPSDTNLTLFEREVSKGDRETQLRRIVGACLKEARQAYDFVLIDSAPGLSVLTECWLREADFYLSPTRPDYISTRGLAFLRKFRQRNPEMGFAELLGVIVNMKDPQSHEDDQYDHWLRQDAGEPLLHAADPARDAAAVGGLLLAERPLLLGQVSGPDRRPAPPPDGRVPAAHRRGAERAEAVGASTGHLRRWPLHPSSRPSDRAGGAIAVSRDLLQVHACGRSRTVSAAPRLPG